MEELGSEDAAIFGAVLWQVWKERNTLLWDGRFRQPTAAVTAAASELSDWVLVQQPSAGKMARVGPCLAWHKPGAGSHKVNVDAAFFGDSMQTSFSMVLRDDQGVFVAAKTVVCHCLKDVDIGEAMGFMEALSWVKNLGLQNVVIEGDAKIVVDSINLKTKGVSAFLDVISVCHLLVSEIVNCSVSFSKREANIMAHMFARVSRVHESLFIGLIHRTLWLDYLFPFVLWYVNKELWFKKNNNNYIW
ncbi:hypothetical protein ACS0TY_026401 [Phlomoides rotata]